MTVIVIVCSPNNLVLMQLLFVVGPLNLYKESEQFSFNSHSILLCDLFQALLADLEIQPSDFTSSVFPSKESNVY